MNKWISCLDALPELDQPVWLCNKNGDIWIGTLTDCGFADECVLLWTNAYYSIWYDTKLDRWECDAELDDDYQVDYWVSLPVLPLPSDHIILERS